MDLHKRLIVSTIFHSIYERGLRKYKTNHYINIHIVLAAKKKKK